MDKKNPLIKHKITPIIMKKLFNAPPKGKTPVKVISENPINNINPVNTPE